MKEDVNKCKFSSYNNNFQSPKTMKKEKIPNYESELLKWKNAPESVPMTNNLYGNGQSFQSRKQCKTSCCPDSPNWVNAPDFEPKNNNSRSRHQMLHCIRKNKVSVCTPDSTNWVNAPEFVPNIENLHSENKILPFIRKGKTFRCGPDSIDWVNAPEFVPNSNYFRDKNRNYCPVIKDKTPSDGLNSSNWANAPEFVPKKKKSFADALKLNACGAKSKPQKLDMELCTHFFEGKCLYNEECPCIHGDLCELCGKYCLNPFDERKRKYHMEYCEKEFVQNMELSFAIQRSLDKTCGICMDVIMEKDPATERRFGILEKCNHVFCLSCIRKWRSAKALESAQYIGFVFDRGVNRACPECRIPSGFIIPSQYWIDAEEEKKKLIADYKVALSKKPCKYFKRGKGVCPFGGACFYLHAKPDGTKVDLPLPSRRRRQNQSGEIDFVNAMTLWYYLEERDQSNMFGSI